MKKSMRMSLIIVAIAIAVPIATILIATTLLTPNDFKNSISSYVLQKTGRSLTIAGDVKWSFFPWLGIRATHINLSNETKFDATPFATIGEADVEMRALPLLFGHADAEKIRLKNANIYLTKNSAGKSNWQDLLSKPNAAKQAPKPLNRHNTKAKHQLFIPSNIALIAANIHFNDQQRKENAEVSNLRLSIPTTTFNRSMHLNSSFNFSLNNNKYAGHIRLATDLGFDRNSSSFNLTNTKLFGKIHTQSQPNIQTNFYGNILANLSQQTVSTQNLGFNVQGIKGNITLTGNHVVDAPSYKGRLTINQSDPHSLLTKLGITLHDTKLLHSVAANCRFITTPTSMVFPQFDIKLDNADFIGTVNQLNLKQKSSTFNVKITDFNFDSYINELNKFEKSDNEPHITNVANSTTETAFKPWSITGVIDAYDIIFKKMHITKLNTNLAVKQNIIKLVPFNMSLYNGTAKSQVQIDKSSALTRYKISATLSNIDIHSLLTDIANNQNIIGTARTNFRLTATGNSADTVRKSLSGSGRVMIHDGTLKGINIAEEITKVDDLLVGKKQSKTTTNIPQTNFTSAEGSFMFRDGVLRNNDFVMRGSNFEVTGEGTANLLHSTLDYHLLACKGNCQHAAESKNTLNSLPIPIRITGTFDKPHFMPDLDYVLKQIRANKTYKQLAAQAINRALGFKLLG